MRLIECHKFNELNTALPNIWAEQSACTSPDENAAQFSSDQKMSEKEVALIFDFKGTLLSDNF